MSDVMKEVARIIRKKKLPKNWKRIYWRINNEHQFEVDGRTFFIEPIPQKPPYEVGMSCMRPADFDDIEDDVIFEALQAYLRKW